MLSIAEKAHVTYDQIKSIGRCPTNSIRSDSLGEISSFSRSKMGFEVVCEKNNILLKITMHDKYVVSLINSRVEASDLTKLANSVLNELRKH